MEFDSATVRHLAELARVRLSDAEIDRMALELHAITDAIDSIQEVSQSDIEPTTHAVELYNAMRDDVPEPSLTVEQALSGAPEQQDHKFQSPKILGEE
jgi:aspartyl-tRNA(Asn)/glutamyl-tRNA(Gln) amidotransferase subunit C